MGPHPDGSDLYGSCRNDGSALDGRSCSLYLVLTLSTQIYTESLLNDKSSPDGRSYSLYRVLTQRLDLQEALLKDVSDPDSHSYNLYQIITLTARLIRRLS